MKLLLSAAAVAALVTFNDGARDHAYRWLQVGLDPIYTWTTRAKVGQLTHILQAEAAAGRPVPTRSSELPALLERSPRVEDLSKDAWATPFGIERQRFVVRVVSAGPDRTFGTEDDIKGEPIAAPQR